MSATSTGSGDFGARYGDALVAYTSLEVRDAALAEAFDLGREAIDAGLGILDLSAVHAAAFARVLQADGPERLAMTSKRASEFLAESLAPFEMVHRGFRETNAEIQNLNRELTTTVDELRQLAAIVEAAGDAIHTVSTENAILSWNPAAERLYGYVAAEVIGENANMLLPLGHAEEGASIVAAMSRNETVAGFETVRRRKDGGFVDVSLTISPIADDEGRIRARAVIARDISARKHAEDEQGKLEQQLRQAQKMEAVGNLAGGIAHDFNNLLTVIRGYVAMLIDRLGGDAESSRQAVLIADAADRAAVLTRQLLAFSRQQVLRPEPTIVNDIVTDTLRLLGRVIGENIKVESDLAADLEPILVDRGQLGQVILNLAINARDAMPDGGTLVFRTGSVELNVGYAAEHVGVVAGSHVLLQVTDSGTGMDADTRERVFDPFFTTKADGTGLGLATVYGIVNQSGGHVWLYSELGTGTTFKIYFPVLTDIHQPLPPAATADVVSLDGTETVLLVEDDDAVRELVVLMLEDYGYTVIEASAPAEALALVAGRSDFSLLLTDVVMPGMNGRELAEALLVDRPGLRIVFTSGYPADTIIRHGIADATAAYIEKPYLPIDLAHKLREVLDKPDGGSGQGWLGAK